MGRESLDGVVDEVRFPDCGVRLSNIGRDMEGVDQPTSAVLASLAGTALTNARFICR